MVSSPAAWGTAKTTGTFRSWLARRRRLGVGLVTGAILFAPVTAILGMTILAHAIARVFHVLPPGVLTLNYCGLEQNHQLALQPAAIGVLECVTDDGDIAQARHLAACARIRLLHQAADCHDVAVHHPHD